MSVSVYYMQIIIYKDKVVAHKSFKFLNIPWDEIYCILMSLTYTITHTQGDKNVAFVGIWGVSESNWFLMPSIKAQF